MRISVEKLKRLGFDWPVSSVIQKHCVTEDGKVDLAKTLEGLQSSRAYYRGQVKGAFNFKMQTGADYSDFTDRFDDDAQEERELARAISYLEKIIEVVDK